MGYDNYPKYQTTKSHWFDGLPTDWQEKKLKFVCEFGTGWTPPTKQQEYFNGNNIWITIADMNQKYLSESKLSISDKAILDFGFTLIPKGALLYSFKLTVGKVAFAKVPLYTNEAIFFVIPNDAFDIKFLYYLFPVAIIQNASENIYGAKILNQDLIKNAALIEPPNPDISCVL